MKKLFKGVQLFLVFCIIGQYTPITVQAGEQLIEDITISADSSLYTFKAELPTADKDSLLPLLREFDHQEFVIQKPIRLVSLDEGILTENAYYPVLLNNHLLTLIRYNHGTASYTLEDKAVVNQIQHYQSSLTIENSLLFIEVSGQIFGKSQIDLINFSTPPMSVEDCQQLVDQVDFSLLKMDERYDLYSENALLFKNQENESTQSSSDYTENENSTDSSYSPQESTFSSSSEEELSTLRRDLRNITNDYFEGFKVYDKGFKDIPENFKDADITFNKDNANPWSGEHAITLANNFYFIKPSKNGYESSRSLYQGNFSNDFCFTFGTSDKMPFNQKFEEDYAGFSKSFTLTKGMLINELFQFIRYYTGEDIKVIYSTNINDDLALLNRKEGQLLDTYNGKKKLTVVDNQKPKNYLSEENYFAGFKVYDKGFKDIPENFKDADITFNKDNANPWSGEHAITLANNFYFIKPTKKGYESSRSLYQGNFSNDFCFTFGTSDKMPFNQKFAEDYTGFSKSFTLTKGMPINELFQFIRYYTGEDIKIIYTKNISEYLSQLNKGTLPLKFNQDYSKKIDNNANYYAISVPKNGRFTFEVISDSSTYVQLYDKNNNKIKNLGSLSSSGGIVDVTQDLLADTYYLKIYSDSTANYSLTVKDQYFTDNIVTIGDDFTTGGFKKIVYINGIPDKNWSNEYNKQLLNRGPLADAGEFTKKKMLEWSQGIRDTTTDVVFGVQQGISTVMNHSVSFVEQNSLQLAGVMAGSAMFLKGTFVMTAGATGTALFALPSGGTLIGPGAAVTLGGVTLMYGGGVAVISSLSTMSYTGVGTDEDFDDYEEEMNKVMANPNYEKYKVDCSEIAEDLFKVNPKGTVYNIVAEDGGFFDVLEYGAIKPYVYHVVFSYHGYIYDPRYSPSPVLKDIYFRELQAINIKKLHISTIIL